MFNMVQSLDSRNLGYSGDIVDNTGVVHRGEAMGVLVGERILSEGVEQILSEGAAKLGGLRAMGAFVRHDPSILLKL